MFYIIGTEEQIENFTEENQIPDFKYCSDYLFLNGDIWYVILYDNEYIDPTEPAMFIDLECNEFNVNFKLCLSGKYETMSKEYNSYEEALRAYTELEIANA